MPLDCWFLTHRFFFQDLKINALPIIALWVVKIISAIYSSESPVEPGLMLVVPGTVLSEYSFPIGGDNRVKVGAKVILRILLEKRLRIAFLKRLEGILFFIHAEF